MKYIFHSDNLSYVIEDEKELKKFTRRSVLGCSIYIIALIFGGIIALALLCLGIYLLMAYGLDIIMWFFGTLLGA